MSRKKAEVKRTAEINVNEEGTVVIAQEIEQISRAMQRISQGRLKRDAIVSLIHDHSKVNKQTIRIVLMNIEQLERIWLK